MYYNFIKTDLNVVRDHELETAINEQIAKWMKRIKRKGKDTFKPAQLWKNLDTNLRHRILDALECNQNHQCFYCGEDITFSHNAQIDHITPLSSIKLSKAKNDTELRDALSKIISLDNLVLSCSGCNHAKSNSDDFIDPYAYSRKQGTCIKDYFEGCYFDDCDIPLLIRSRSLSGEKAERANTHIDKLKLNSCYRISGRMLHLMASLYMAGNNKEEKNTK